MASVDLNTIRSTIEARLKTELSSAPLVPVIFNNIAYNSTGVESFVQCQISFGASAYLSQSNDSHNSVFGLILLNTYTPEAIGAGANLTIAKRIRDLYNRQAVSSVIFDAPIGPETLTGGPDGFYQTQIRITFEIFENL